MIPQVNAEELYGVSSLEQPFLIDPELWKKTRSGARAGRGFRYQDAVAGWLAASAWSGEAAWTQVVPEGVDDLTMHGVDLEFRAQLKARHDPQGVFTQIEMAKHLAKSAKDLPHDWRANPNLRLALVLERPLTGIQPTGWKVSLSDSGQTLSNFMRLLADALGEPEAGLVDDLLARTHLVVEPDPLERGCAALANALLPPAGVRLVLQQLREQAGQAADANYVAPAKAPETLGRSDVQMRIDGVRGVVDLTGYLALTGGLVELAEFSVHLPSETFYKGVNVAPGHVGAGLVFARPALMADVLAGLEAKRFALVAGPSGAGKSALAWLAAHHTRHTVRWYRVRELRTTDVAKLVQLAKLLEAAPERPIGFVVDDVGQPQTTGWDALVREAEVHAGLLAIGTVREEDVFLLSTAARTPTVRPKLDEDLAGRVWEALQNSGSAKFSHWREPYELSRGLLLEYTHLLTAGERLKETIQEQVRRRLAEDRGDELMLLRAISFAAAQGAAVAPIRLRSLVGLDEIPFAKALRRLIDEHAVRIRPDGALAGLHEIRSTYLDEAVQELLGEPRAAAIKVATAALAPDAFSAFLVRVLRRWPEEEGTILEGLVDRLDPEDAHCWTPIFHGLGLATSDRIAEKWLEISRAAEVDDRLSGTLFTLALAKSELGENEMFAKVKVTQAAFAQVDVPDLRKVLIDRVAGSFRLPSLDVHGVHELIAALLPIFGCKPPPILNFQLEGHLAELPLDGLLALLTTLREYGLEPAEDLVDAAGGTEVLLGRIYRETPWVTRPVVGQLEGMLSVTGYVRYVHPEIQPDLHADVVRLCEAMAAASPNAELLISDVILADGTPFGFGDHTPNTKRIPRESLPAPARVAWNRAQIRSVHRLVAAPNETQRTTALAGAVTELGSRLREAGDFYCRMEVPGPKWRLFLQVRNLLTTFVQPSSIEEAFLGPLEKGDLNDGDKPHSFVEGLQRLICELTDGVSEKPVLMAVRTSNLARDAEALLDPAFWRMTSEPPLKTLSEMRDTLWEIRAVLGNAAADPERRRRMSLRLAKMSRHHSILRRAAEEARQQAAVTLASRREEIRLVLAAQGLSAEVFSRPSSKDAGFQWPDAEFAALLKVESLVDWLTTVESFSKAISSMSDPPHTSYGAVIGDCLAPMGMVFIMSLIPSPSFAQEWAEHLPYRRIDDEDLHLYVETFDTMGAMSSVIVGSGGDLNLKETEFFFYVIGTLHPKHSAPSRKTGSKAQ